MDDLVCHVKLPAACPVTRPTKCCIRCTESLRTNGKSMRMLSRCPLALVFAFGLCQGVWLENCGLLAVPRRRLVELYILHREGHSVFPETRVGPFKKGFYPLQISWANPLIYPSSVE